MAATQSITIPIHFVNKDASNWKHRSKDEKFAIGFFISGKYARSVKVARLKGNHKQALLLSSPANDKLQDDEATFDAVGIEGDADEHGVDIGNEGGEGSTSEPWPAFTLLSSATSATALLSAPLVQGSDFTGTWSELVNTRSPVRDAVTVAYRAGGTNEVILPRGCALQQQRQQQQQKRPQRHPLSAVTVLLRGNSDPFDASLVHISPQNNCATSTWSIIYTHVVLPVSVGPLSRTVAKQAWRKNCERMMDNEAYFRAVIAASLAAQAIETPESARKSDLLQKSMMQRAKSTEALRKSLTDQKLSPELVLSTWQLAIAEAYAFDFCTGAIHFAAVINMIKELGGLSVLPPSLRRQIIRADNFAARIPRRPTLFGQEDVDPGPIELILNPTEAQQLSSLLLITPPTSHPEVPDSIRPIFKDYRHCLIADQFANALPHNSRQLQILFWCLDRKAWLYAALSNLEVKLLTTYAEQSIDTGAGTGINNEPSQSDPSIHALNMATCLTLYYSWRLSWFSPLCNRFRNHYDTFSSLSTPLEALIDRKDLERPHLLLWIVFIGSVMEETQGILLLSRRWHFTRFVRLVRRLEISSVEALKGVLMGFLYDPKVLDGHLERLFARALVW